MCLEDVATQRRMEQLRDRDLLEKKLLIPNPLSRRKIYKSIAVKANTYDIKKEKHTPIQGQTPKWKHTHMISKTWRVFNEGS